MFILISAIHYFIINPEESWKYWFVTIAIVIFIINHILTFSTENNKLKLLYCTIDLIVSIAFGFVFIVDSSLYLIFFGIVSTTIFIQTDRKIVLLLFSLAFAVSWALIGYYQVYVIFNHSILIYNLLSLTFILFAGIVGSLIRKLMIAGETIEDQLEQLTDSHHVLEDAHQQLSAYAQKVEEFTAIQERNRIAREIHDRVGHKMTALLVQIQLARELMTLDKKQCKEALQNAEQLTRNSLEEIRMSVRTLQDETKFSLGFSEALKQMLNEFANMTSLHITLSIEGDLTNVPHSLQTTIKRVIQEALTNVKRHSDGTQCDIIIKSSDDEIRIEIIDNGKGSNNVTAGFGLMNMRERVLEHGGAIQFGSESSKGFFIKMSFPLRVLKWHTNEVLS